MNLIWKAPALSDLIEIRQYISQDNPDAAQGVSDHLRKLADRLLSHPLIGRIGRMEGTRELVVTKFPYVLVYQVKADRVEILRVMHTSRMWPK